MPQKHARHDDDDDPDDDPDTDRDDPSLSDIDEDDHHDDENDDETVPCPACGRAVFEDAQRCPECGTYITPRAVGQRPVWVWITAVVLLVVIVVGWVLS